MGQQNNHASTFATRLRTLLEQYGLSIREASKIAGVSHSVIHDWSVGTTPNNFKAVQRLARCFNTSFEWLLTGEEADGAAWRGIIEDGEEIFKGVIVLEGTIRRIKPLE